MCGVEVGIFSLSLALHSCVRCSNLLDLFVKQYAHAGNTFQIDRSRFNIFEVDSRFLNVSQLFSCLSPLYTHCSTKQKYPAKL